MEFVYYAVRAETLWTNQINGCSLSGRALAQAVSRWPLKIKAWFRSRASPYYIYGGRSGIGIGLSPSTSVSGCSYRLSIVAHSCCSWQTSKPVKTGNLPNSNVLSEIEKHFIEKYFRFK